MRARFRLTGGYPFKVPMAYVPALEAALGCPLAPDTGAYRNRIDHGEDADPRYTYEPTEPDDAAEFFYPESYRAYDADIRKVIPALPPDVGMEIEGSAEPRPLLELADQLEELKDRIAGLANRTTEKYVNGKVDVHVPGNKLLDLDRVFLLDDACTDEVQRRLEGGWRIVAVCPQPDQRRPDYILGGDSTVVGSR